MSYIYKISVGVDMLGSTPSNIKTDYSMKVYKHKIQKETDLNYILLGRNERVKKQSIGIIQDGHLTLNTRCIRFDVWLIDKEDIKKYKSKMILKIRDKISILRNELQILEDAMKNEMKMYLDDRSKIDEIEKFEVTEDMF